MTSSLLFFLPRLAAGLLPVLAFLGALRVLDSYKLVRLRPLGAALAAGALAAGLCYVAQTSLIAGLALDRTVFSRYLAPLVEETAKAVYVAYVVRAHRVGFQVDAAILGFAVGTGFALVENVYYLGIYPEAGLSTWLLRGLGTAVMHGGTACLFGIVSKTLSDRAERPGLALFLPGLGLAYALHALFNHFLLPPLATTALLMVVFPPLVALVFQQSERYTRAWLGTGFDTDQALLERLTFGTLAEDRVGRYLLALKTRFPGEVVADMLCLLRLRVELSIRAKGLLMMREAGFEVMAGPDVRATLDEVRYLERSIGPTGMRALAPFLPADRRDRWQRELLQAG